MSVMSFRSIPVEDRQQFLRCMVSVMRADGTLDPNEIATLHEVMLAWDLGVAELETLHRCLRTGEESVFVGHLGFVDPRSSYLLVRTLIRLGYDDGAYCEEEQLVVREIAKHYRVPESRVVALEAFVQADVALHRAGDALLEPVHKG
jgi:uncharacterized tellurite resistance protein B-like protein